MFDFNLVSFNFTVMSFRYAEQVSNGDEVLVQGNYKLNPQKVVNVSDISLPGNNHNYIFHLKKIKSPFL